LTRDILILMVGVIAGGAMNLSVNLALRHIERRRTIAMAARTLYDELYDFGYEEINAHPVTETRRRVRAAWREHRATLVDVDDQLWDAVDEIVLKLAYPSDYADDPPESHNSRLELALYLLEPHARRPETLRRFK
jgi:hypothetical protein